MTPLIHLLSDRLYYTGVCLDNSVRLTVSAGITAVIGANGAGKSTLGNILEKGWNFRTNRIESADGRRLVVRKIEFSDIHSLAGMHVEYYQQRYEATMNEEVPTVAEIVGAAVGTQRWRELTAIFRLTGVEQRKINYLSSGELRKLLIINSLLTPADLLILDNPYIGLDAASRTILDSALESLSAAGVAVMLLVARPDDIPPLTSCIVPMSDMAILEPITGFASVDDVRRGLERLFDYAVDMSTIPLPPRIDNEPLDSLLILDHCRVDYGARPIIDSLSWRVDDYQFWALTGPNGCGKSTLLSLICADNPQAYSNSITLFGRRRGTGETIWDIKRRIAYISPELSLHFHPSGSVATIIAQGLNDTSGQYTPLRPGQLDLALRWMRILHLEHLADRAFNTLSSGERQLVLLARVFIKQPRLLILDEPMHGLDFARARAVRAVINYFAARAIASEGRLPMAMIFVSHYAWELPECLKCTKTLSAPSRL